jgi:hypothetical protein
MKKRTAKVKVSVKKVDVTDNGQSSTMSQILQSTYNNAVYKMRYGN